MKILILITATILIGSFALAGEKDSFNEHKQHFLKEMDEQISALQTAKSCISRAADHESMKRCQEEREKARKHHKETEINERIHKLEEEKAKLNQGN